MTKQIGPTLYKRDTKGKVRVWKMETNGAKYRTIAGLQDGQKVTSEWTKAIPTNVGRANERSDWEQAEFEVNAIYTKKLEKGYFRTLETIDAPRFSFEPMLAKTYKKWSGPVFSQPKLDGVRCIAKKDGLFTRNGKPFMSVPHIAEALKDFFEEFPDVILDGELYNHVLKEDFNQIISLVRQQKPTQEDLDKSSATVQYHIYDCIDPDPTKSFYDRRDNLDNLFFRDGHFIDHDSLRLVETEMAHDVEQLDQFYSRYLSWGFEGQMVRFNKPYENKRSAFLLKRKIMEDAEFEVVEVEEGKGNWSGYAKKIACKLADGTVFRAGLAGDQLFAKKLLIDADNYVGGTATIKYQNLTPDGIPRFGIVTAIYEGKREL
jgi:DNA ligase-1